MSLSSLPVLLCLPSYLLQDDGRTPLDNAVTEVRSSWTDIMKRAQDDQKKMKEKEEEVRCGRVSIRSLQMPYCLPIFIRPHTY